MAKATDVVVVGGGVTGVGISRDLALRGVDVTLLERDGLASGTSGRSHGLLHSGARYAESDPVDAAQCAVERDVIAAIAGACVDETGGLFVQLPGDDATYFDRKVAACREAGVEATVLESDDARSTVPELDPRLERAISVDDAVVYPSRLVAATAADAREHGATIHTHAPVEAVHVAPDDGQSDRAAGSHVTGVTAGGTVDERIDATFVVNAAGAWAGQCAALAGVEVSMSPTRGAMVVVEHDALGTVLNRCRPPADGDIVVPHPSRAVLGTTSESVSDPDEFDRKSAEVKRVVAECAAMLPPLADCPVARVYWGVRPLYEPNRSSRGEDRAISRGFFVLDHREDGVGGFASVVGGKLTTHRLMAERTADLICERLGVSTGCRTDERPLTGVDDPARLDALVSEFDAGGAADADVVGSQTE